MAQPFSPILEPLAERLYHLQELDSRSVGNDRIYKRAQSDIERLFKEICGAVRTDSSPEVVAGADVLLNELVEVAYGSNAELYDFLPSLAHDDQAGSPLVKDSGANQFGSSATGVIGMFIQLMSASLGLDGALQSLPIRSGEPYNPATKMHERSTPLAIFRSNLPAVSLSDTPLAEAIYQARCSISSERISSPILLTLPSNSSMMGLVAAGGFKDRDPALTYYNLDSVANSYDGMPTGNWVDVGLTHIAQQLEMDMSERKLVWIADQDRVKSYVVGLAESEDDRDWLPKHTLDSKHSGPVILMNDGATMLRVGSKAIESWNVDELPNHGRNGRKIVGKKLRGDDLDSWRDEPEDIEPSSGTKASLTTDFSGGHEMEPGVCTKSPNNPSSLLCSSSERTVSCVQYDLGDGSISVANRYLGHGAAINAFSTSVEDPHSFLTAANDGIVRLFDVREPLPKMSFDAGVQSEGSDCALYFHVQGVPYVFTGGTKLECIKLWDVRARATVYELSTGNNAVRSMAWDSAHNTLYAATVSFRIDRNGYHFDYRPRRTIQNPNAGNDEEEEDPDVGWPRDAWHNEGEFGYAFDAGNHTLIRYAFGVDNSATVLPEDSQVYPGRTLW